MTNLRSSIENKILIRLFCFILCNPSSGVHEEYTDCIICGKSSTLTLDLLINQVLTEIVTLMHLYTGCRATKRTKEGAVSEIQK